jgi:hypothetical protein
MIRVMLVVALVWLALMPPFFTGGACTAEFDLVARQIQDNRPALAYSASAQAYWNSVHIPAQLITAPRCRVDKPGFIDRCGRGDLLYVAVPIQNRICRFYRDSDVRVQLQYDDHGRLRQLQADMKPFKYFSLPWLGLNFYWGR